MLERELTPDYSGAITENDLLEERAMLRKKQNAIGVKQIYLDVLIEKAEAKIERIKQSKAIPYQVAGGEITRQKDLNFAIAVHARLEKRWQELNVLWNEIENRLEEIISEIKNLD